MADGLTLNGRTAIVTGAGNGLGRAEAIALAAAGARVVLNDLPGPAVHETAEEIIAAGGEVLVHEGDIGDWQTGQDLVTAAIAAFGEPRRIRTVFLASEHGSADGMWSLESVASALAPMAGSGPPSPGFACEDTLALAGETTGFPAGDGSVR